MQVSESLTHHAIYSLWSPTAYRKYPIPKTQTAIALRVLGFGLLQDGDVRFSQSASLRHHNRSSLD
jgi:hypothetical protein